MIFHDHERSLMIGKDPSWYSMDLSGFWMIIHDTYHLKYCRILKDQQNLGILKVLNGILYDPYKYIGILPSGSGQITKDHSRSSSYPGVLWAGDAPRVYRGSIFSARTWLQLMCCTTRHLLSSNFGRGADEGEVRMMSSWGTINVDFRLRNIDEVWNV